MTVDPSPAPAPTAATRARHVRGRSPILDVVTDLHDDVLAASFPLDLPGVVELRDLRDRLETRIGAHLLPRLRREAGPAVVVLGGSTGAGKSTLLNSVVGSEVTDAGVIRPTTIHPVLTIAGPDAWLVAGHPITELAQVVEHDHVPAGLALLDTPDLDSVVARNRELGNLLLEAADLWLFVTTAARYGDAVPWQVLSGAQQRGVSIAVVLNRVSRDVLNEVRADLMRRMTEVGLGSAPLFVIPDVGPHEGPLSPATVAPLRDWLTLLGGRHTSRGVVRRTTQGVWASLREELLQLADGIAAQAAAADALRSGTEQAVSDAATRATRRLRDGVAADGAPTTRWLAAASTGGALAPLTRDVTRVRRGWRGSGVRARSAAAGTIGADTRQALASVLLDACAGARAGIWHAWSAPEHGARDLFGAFTPPVDPDQRDRARRGRATAAIADWAARVDALAERTLRDAPASSTKALDAAGLSALLQAAAAGLDGAVRAVRALLPSSGPAEQVAEDLTDTVADAVRAEAAPYLDGLDGLGLRSEAGAGLRLRASELKGHR